MADLTEQQLLSTDPEVLGLQRQRALANLLTGQAFNQPQGQIISGHYVRPSALQQALPMINAAIGGLTNANLDTKQTELAAALRGQKAEAFTKFQELMSNPATRGEAMKYAAGNQYLQPLAQELMKGMKLGEGEKFVMPNLGGGAPVELASGGTKYRAPLQIDTGTAIEIRDPNDPTKVLQRLPKTHVFAPHASQLVPVQGGFAEYNPNTKTFLPIGGGQGGAAGTPTGALMPPLPGPLQTQASSINEQKSTINDVLKAVEGNRQYFGAKYAAPGIFAGELGTSKMNQKLPSDAVEARSQVFNTASSVIKERAGTAQSKNESAIIMRFLPSEFDTDKVIIDKLNGFNKYLESKEKGISPVVGAIQTYRPGAAQTSAVTTGNKTQNFDPALLQFMTPEQQALFKQPGN
jgi:hypothetical protein